MVIKKILEKTSSAIDDVKYHAESSYQSVVDSVDGVVDYTSAAFLKACAGIIGTYQAIKVAGVSIALVAAPVPTLIAMAVLWLMELSIESINRGIDNELKNKEKKREFDRVVKMLKKYGKIPKTALVETPLVKMSIDSITGTVEGAIRAGNFKGISLNEIADDDLLNLASTSSDSETKSLLESYVSYRKKQATR